MIWASADEQVGAVVKSEDWQTACHSVCCSLRGAYLSAAIQYSLGFMHGKVAAVCAAYHACTCLQRLSSD